MTVKTNTMISIEAWDKLKKQIEYHLKQDNNLTIHQHLLFQKSYL